MEETYVGTHGGWTVDEMQRGAMLFGLFTNQSREPDGFRAQAFVNLTDRRLRFSAEPAALRYFLRLGDELTAEVSLNDRGSGALASAFVVTPGAPYVQPWRSDVRVKAAVRHRPLGGGGESVARVGSERFELAHVFPRVAGSPWAVLVEGAMRQGGADGDGGAPIVVARLALRARRARPATRDCIAVDVAVAPGEDTPALASAAYAKEVRDGLTLGTAVVLRPRALAASLSSPAAPASDVLSLHVGAACSLRSFAGRPLHLRACAAISPSRQDVCLRAERTVDVGAASRARVFVELSASSDRWMASAYPRAAVGFELDVLNL